MEDKGMDVRSDAAFLDHPLEISREDFRGVMKIVGLQVARMVGWHTQGCVELVK